MEVGTCRIAFMNRHNGWSRALRMKIDEPSNAAPVPSKQQRALMPAGESLYLTWSPFTSNHPQGFRRLQPTPQADASISQAAPAVLWDETRPPRNSTPPNPRQGPPWPTTSTQDSVQRFFRCHRSPCRGRPQPWKARVTSWEHKIAQEIVQKSKEWVHKTMHERPIKYFTPTTDLCSTGSHWEVEIETKPVLFDNMSNRKRH